MNFVNSLTVILLRSRFTRFQNAMMDEISYKYLKRHRNLLWMKCFLRGELYSLIAVHSLSQTSLTTVNDPFVSTCYCLIKILGVIDAQKNRRKRLKTSIFWFWHSSLQNSLSGFSDICISYKWPKISMGATSSSAAGFWTVLHGFLLTKVIL